MIMTARRYIIGVLLFSMAASEKAAIALKKKAVSNIGGKTNKTTIDHYEEEKTAISIICLRERHSSMKTISNNLLKKRLKRRQAGADVTDRRPFIVGYCGVSLSIRRKGIFLMKAASVSWREIEA